MRYDRGKGGNEIGLGKETSGMDEHSIIDHLEELATKFGIKIRYELINHDDELTKAVGGLCRLKGEYVLIINPEAPVREKIRIFAEALTNFELDQIYIKPALRELLDKDSQ